MGLVLKNEDIVKQKVDAIVNAANNELKCGGGVCGAIFAAAGKDNLAKECAKIGFCKTGETCVTSGGNLYAKYIFHTVGPRYMGGKYNEKKLLYKCYENSLLLAIEKKCKSIAFPLISSGIYGYPKEEAIYIAIQSILEFLTYYDLDVTLILLGDHLLQTGQKIYEQIQKDL